MMSKEKNVRRIRHIHKKISAAILALMLTLPLAAFAMTDDGVFTLIGGNTYCFSNGTAGWSTEFVISHDGSFTGLFHDSYMGDIGNGYPNGTVYECAFSGTFAITAQIDPYTYELRLTALGMEGDMDAESIVDGVKFITTDVYGISGGDVFMLYRTGRETANLPEAFLECIRMPNAWEKVPDTLPFYGLYDFEEGAGFFSYAEIIEDALYEYDELAGVWQTAEDDDVSITLLLYPADAFRLYHYYEDETFMLEGIRVVEGDVIIVSDIRLGIQGAEGNYTHIGEKDTIRFIFSLDLVGAPTLTLTNEEGDTIIIYPVVLDSTG